LDRPDTNSARTRFLGKYSLLCYVERISYLRRKRPSALKQPSWLRSSEPFLGYRLPRNEPPRDRPEFPIRTKRVTVKYRVLPYSSRSHQGQARADASAPRTSGSQAAAHNPRAARPVTA